MTVATSYLPEIHRLLPQSGDAEQGVLCSILLAPDYAFERCAENGIETSSFHIPAHGTIFSALSTMHEAREPIDVITLTKKLRDNKTIDQAGGPAFVSELFIFLPTAANVGFYAKIMEEKATLRGIIAVATDHAGRAYDEQDEVTNLLDSFEAKVLAISGRRYQGDANGIVEVPAKEGVMAAINAIEELYERKGKISGLTTGLHDLDKLIDGLHAEDFVVIGARPSMGKTALLMDIALHVAIHEKVRVAVFSAEMSAPQLYQRALCSLAKVNVRNLRDGLLTERDFPALTAAAAKIAGSKLLVLDAVGASIGAVRARARRLHRKEPLGLVVVDYLQKLRHPPSAKFREREISEVSEGLKNLNKELKVPVITAAQINRAPDSRSGESKGVPRLSDLRESGSIEQDADVVMLLNRPEMHATDEKEKQKLEGLADLEIAKQRDGPLGDVRLTFLKEFTTFQARAREAAPEPRNYQQD